MNNIWLNIIKRDKEWNKIKDDIEKEAGTKVIYDSLDNVMHNAEMASGGGITVKSTAIIFLENLYKFRTMQAWLTIAIGREIDDLKDFDYTYSGHAISLELGLKIEKTPTKEIFKLEISTPVSVNGIEDAISKKYAEQEAKLEELKAKQTTDLDAKKTAA